LAVDPVEAPLDVGAGLLLGQQVHGTGLRPCRGRSGGCGRKLRWKAVENRVRLRRTVTNVIPLDDRPPDEPPASPARRARLGDDVGTDHAAIEVPE
jgi:hypothetical protein